MLSLWRQQIHLRSASIMRKISTLLADEDLRDALLKELGDRILTQSGEAGVIQAAIRLHHII
jgi:hypothetical protein